MKKITCGIQFNESIWAQINAEMDKQGKIFVSNEEYIQVMPLTDANFMPEVQKTIEIIFNTTSQIALGLFINWLYDKLKQQKTKKITVNKQEYEVTDKKSIQVIIIKCTDEK